ncbi:hypothetical protein M885DRAFT_613856 [Pelagophyceae sp. CCMP2097]|nr:hypothetical protein M885DRAFT_613856 [Pelagophyceae sp. CCMP2097]
MSHVGAAVTDSTSSKFRKKGFGDIYGASTDSVEANKAFHDKFSFSFPLLSDLDKSMTQSFNCCKPSGDDACAMSARVCVVVSEGKIEQYLSPFDAKEGPAALLASL